MELSYRVVLRTRSTDQDYFWVGHDPDEWWTQGWGDSLLRRQPCYLRNVRAGGVRLLLTGVVSGRRDVSQTLIRYEVAMESSLGDGGVPRAQVDWLIRAWWEQRKSATSDPWPLGLKLDQVLGRRAAERRVSVDTLLELRNAAMVESGLRRLPKADVTESPKSPEGAAWVGSEYPDVSDYLDGTRSLAYFAAVNRADADAGLELPSDVVAIIDGDSGRRLRGEIRGTRPKVCAASWPQSSKYQFRIWAIVLFVLLLAVTVLWILL